MKKYIHIIIAALILFCATRVIAQNYTLYDEIPYNTISGVNQNLLSLDVYKPTLFSGNRPVMIYIHGGYWKAGDKNNVGEKAKLFTDSGYVFVSINYRLSPDPVDTLSTTAVRFPIHPQDCADAIKWVFDNISTYSGDTSKVSLIGHSAGAHLVLLLSTNHTFLQNAGVNPQSIKCTCSLDCGVFDLFYELDQAGSNIQRRAPLINAFGTDTSLYDDASPIYHVEQGKYLPYIQLVHQGTTNQINSNYMFRDSLLANSHSNIYTFNAFPYEHEIINQALGNPLDSIGMTNSVIQFFSNCLANNITTGIGDYTNQIAQIHIFPNPTQSQLTISNLPTDFSGMVSIYNVMGQLMFLEPKTGSQFSIQTGELNSGIYFVQVKTDKGETMIRKFIKD